jgi:hypothetical protein
MVIRLDSGLMRYGLPGLVLGLGLAWFSGARAQEAAAQSQSTAGTASQGRSAGARPADPSRQTATRPSASAEANGTMALISGTGGPVQLLYLIDTKEHAFAVYVIDPTNSKGFVKLEGSRQYKWDLKLEHYNNQAPEPDAIKATVESLARSAQ